MDKLVGGISNIKIFDNTLFHLDDTYQQYQEYLANLLKLEPKYLKYFLITLKNREIVNNQETELEESFLVELYQLSQRKDSIDIMMKNFNDGKITKEELKKIHCVVIKGSIDDIPENYDYRADNNKWVGYYGTNGEQRVDYMPPDYKEIEELITYTLDFLNNKGDNDLFNNIFIKPLIVHALIAYIQPFGNGNTRLARVIQHGKMWQLSKENMMVDLPYPSLYLSKNYLLTRPQYRGIIKNLAIEQDDNAWNKWFNYNLNMIDEQLFNLDKNLDMYRKSI